MSRNFFHPAARKCCYRKRVKTISAWVLWVYRGFPLGHCTLVRRLMLFKLTVNNINLVADRCRQLIQVYAFVLHKQQKTNMLFFVRCKEAGRGWREIPHTGCLQIYLGSDQLTCDCRPTKVFMECGAIAAWHSVLFSECHASHPAAISLCVIGYGY